MVTSLSQERVQVFPAPERVQVFACKMATHNWKANFHELQSLVDIPTLERRRLELKLGHLFKIIHNLCFSPQGVIVPREQTPLASSTQSAHSLSLVQPYAHTNSYLYSFVPHTISCWNSLPQELLNASSLNTFKSKLRVHNFYYCFVVSDLVLWYSVYISGFTVIISIVSAVLAYYYFCLGSLLY